MPGCRRDAIPFRRTDGPSPKQRWSGWWDAGPPRAAPRRCSSSARRGGPPRRVLARDRIVGRVRGQGQPAYRPIGTFRPVTCPRRVHGLSTTVVGENRATASKARAELTSGRQSSLEPHELVIVTRRSCPLPGPGSLSLGDHRHPRSIVKPQAQRPEAPGVIHGEGTPMMAWTPSTFAQLTHRREGRTGWASSRGSCSARSPASSPT